MRTMISRRFASLRIVALLAGGACALSPGPSALAVDPDPVSLMGLQPGLGSLPLLGRGRTRSVSAENPTGEPGRGGQAIPDPAEPKPAASARAADNLGQGWKVRPFIRLDAGKT